VLLGLWQVLPQVDVLAANDAHMLMLEELDVARTHETVDHESNKPMHVRIDHTVPFKNLCKTALLAVECCCVRVPAKMSFERTSSG